MSVSFLLTEGLGFNPGNTRYICTLGYATSTSSVDTHDGGGPIRKEKRKYDWDRYRIEKEELRNQIEALYHGTESNIEAALTAVKDIEEISLQAEQASPDLLNLISAYKAFIELKRHQIQDRDDEEAIMWLM